MIRAFDPEAPQPVRRGEALTGPEIHAVAAEVGPEADLQGLAILSPKSSRRMIAGTPPAKRLRRRRSRK